MLVIDYYSRFIEICKLSNTTSEGVINQLKSIFARHVTSSPRYPQANGEAERAVKTMKQLLDKSQDPYIALLSYQSTPIKLGYSPAELLMGSNLRSTVPMTNDQLINRSY